MILPVTLTAAAAAAILNFWLGLRVGQLRVRNKVIHGDDGGGILTRRMRAQANFVEYTPFALFLIAAIELAGKGGLWLSLVAAIYMLGRIAHAIGMDAETGNPPRMIGFAITALTLIALAVVAALIAMRVI